MKAEKIYPGWETQLPVAEKAFRAMGLFDAADRARQKFEATQAAVAAGSTGVLGCEWYDRGRSVLPSMFQDDRGSTVIVKFGQISVELQLDQMVSLWALLSVAVFPQGVDLLNATRDLAVIAYDAEGNLHPEILPSEETS